MTNSSVARRLDDVDLFFMFFRHYPSHPHEQNLKHKNAHFHRQVLHHSGLHVPTTVSSSRHHNKHESSRSMCAVVRITPVELHGRAHGRQRAVVNESLMRSWRTETPVCRGRGNSFRCSLSLISPTAAAPAAAVKKKN